MSVWKIAAVQTDCRLADREHNLAVVRDGLRRAADAGARLIVFPECMLTGYCFTSLAEALPLGETLPGPSSDVLVDDCRRLGVWAVVGMLERSGAALFNACALVGPNGLAGSYRKIHLPCLGVDRFTTPGDRPFAVHDLGGLRIGLNICYDGSFPESARTLTLLGADLVVLSTNWPPNARSTMSLLVPARALENHIYYAAVNRIGTERGHRFIGNSRIVAPSGELLAVGGEETAEILYGDIDPAQARAKRRILVPGEYEIDRVNDRRPEMYRPLCEPRRTAL
jgi:predicted amidohydrolase